MRAITKESPRDDCHRFRVSILEQFLSRTVRLHADRPVRHNRPAANPQNSAELRILSHFHELQVRLLVCIATAAINLAE